MNLEQRLESADLEKRRNDLDEREQLVVEKERLLDASTRIGKIAVLDKQIENKTSQLQRLDADLDEKRHFHSVEIAELEGKHGQTLKKIATAHIELKDVNARSKALIDKNKVMSGELEAVKDEVTKRKRYLEEQEADIAQIATNANDRLHELRFESEKVEDDKRKLLAEIINLERQRDAANEELSQAQIKKKGLDDLYQAKAADYRSELSGLAAEVAQETAALADARKKRSSYMVDLDNREKALRIKQHAQHDREIELNNKERRLRSNYAVAERDYNEA